VARKPNYGFERNERERIKAEKKARRAAEKNAARTEEPRHSDPAVGRSAGESGKSSAE